MVLQFGGASGNGYLSVAQREAANDALKQKGEFKNGALHLLRREGQRHNRTVPRRASSTRRVASWPSRPPRYEDVIVMDPSAYAWIPQGAEGVYVKLAWLLRRAERRESASSALIATRYMAG